MNKQSALDKMREAVEQMDKDRSLSDIKKELSGDNQLVPIFRLDGDAERMFDIVVHYLSERGLIESVDVITITMLAKSLALYVEVARQIHGHRDVIQEYPNGTSNVSGIFTALTKTQEQVLKLSAKLGLSPMDRARIFGAASNVTKARDKSSEGDEIDDLT